VTGSMTDVLRAPSGSGKCAHQALLNLDTSLYSLTDIKAAQTSLKPYLNAAAVLVESRLITSKAWESRLIDSKTWESRLNLLHERGRVASILHSEGRIFRRFTTLTPKSGKNSSLIANAKRFRNRCLTQKIGHFGFR